MKPEKVDPVRALTVGNVGNAVGNRVEPAMVLSTRASSESERVAKWREANRERDNARRREYMRKRRAKV
jgi:hypothetical protein